MSKTATISFSANISGDSLVGGNLGPVTYTATSSPVQHTVVSLGSGNNTILIPTLPAQATWVRILPSSGAGNLFLKGANADTGVQISSTNETWLALSTAISSFVVNASTTSTVEFYFF